jgi:hypothetical protein
MTLGDDVLRKMEQARERAHGTVWFAAQACVRVCGSSCVRARDPGAQAETRREGIFVMPKARTRACTRCAGACVRTRHRGCPEACPFMPTPDRVPLLACAAAPQERIEIVSTYVYSASADASGVGAAGGGGGGGGGDSAALEKCQAQVKGLQLDMHSMRAAKLPS